ncbi:hypothetical protein OHB26_30910 [Nocardia sp. NBC_01503]|uniref:hypothetical protein n=1 Tax=Nocardia sp. NBC_01503 TaxID=2975997 RepID=UPI002E7B4DB9|nr:hypothetical protein [Nocardia sp. NBC_01503]WTL31289.1 hypothetical protein OHB26_30910 [Nocardia sp. NBC_01503]
MSIESEQAKQLAAEENTVTGGDVRSAGPDDRPIAERTSGRAADTGGRTATAGHDGAENLSPDAHGEASGRETQRSDRERHEDPTGATHSGQDPALGQTRHSGQSPEFSQQGQGFGQAPHAGQRSQIDDPRQPGQIRNPGQSPRFDEARGQHGQRTPATDPTQLRGQWREVQGMFVDDPKDAVTRADQLVSGTIQALADDFAQRRQQLEQRWQHGNGSDTEELRQALRGYRELFDQLMTASAGGATNI